MSYVGIFCFCGGGNFFFIVIFVVKLFWYGGKNVLIVLCDIIFYNKINIEIVIGIENVVFLYIFYKY